MNKAQIIAWLLTVVATIDTLWGVIAENSGLLADFGVSPKVTKIIMALGIIWTAFTRSLAQKKQSTQFFSDPPKGAGTPNTAP